MNILTTICARAGSKGVKSKNTRDFAGYPLAYYTLSAYSLFVKEFGNSYDTLHLAVNTDSTVLLEQLDKTNISYDYIPRKEDLGGDYVSKADVIKDTMLAMEEKYGITYDYVLDLDLTSPLRMAKDIEGVLQVLIADNNADMSYSVTDSRRLPFFNMVMKKENGYYDNVIQSTYVSRQQAPQCFDMNASIYAYRRAFLLNTSPEALAGCKALIWPMVDTAVLDIDSEKDLELMEYLSNFFFEKYEELRQVKDDIINIIN